MRLVCLLCLLLSLAVPAQEDLEAAAWLKRVLAADYAGEETLFGKTALVGPFLWSRLKTRMIIDPSDDVPTTFLIPRVEGSLMAQGRGLQSPASIEAFASALRESLDSFEVRRLTAEELELLDTLWAFDLEGTLLAVESQERRFLIIFVKDRPFAFFEIPPEITTREQVIQALATLESTGTEPSPRTSLLDSDELPQPPSDPGGPSSVILITDQEMVAARLDVAVFQDYIDRLEAILEANPQEGRFLAQIDFDSSGRTVVRTSNENLEEQLAEVAPPPTKGPIAFILVKDY